MGDRGCDFCGDDQNLPFGHVSQVASNEARGVLLRCPKCGCLYLDARDGLTDPYAIEPADAATWFDCQS
jgi:hypothetical protein